MCCGLGVCLSVYSRVRVRVGVILCDPEKASKSCDSVLCVLCVCVRVVWAQKRLFCVLCVLCIGCCVYCVCIVFVLCVVLCLLCVSPLYFCICVYTYWCVLCQLCVCTVGLVRACLVCVSLLLSRARVLVCEVKCPVLGFFVVGETKSHVGACVSNLCGVCVCVGFFLGSACVSLRCVHACVH